MDNVQTVNNCIMPKCVCRSAVVIEARIAEVSERLGSSPYKTLRKIAAVVAKQRRQCNYFQRKCMLFSSCYHRR
jgi:hypothetical protein